MQPVRQQILFTYKACNMLKMIVYIISQMPAKYKTNFIKLSQRKTDILYREIAAKSHFIFEKSVKCPVLGCKKAHPCFRMSFFAHEARYRLCGAGTVSCEGEQPEEEVPGTRYLFLKQEEKDFMNQKGVASFL